MSLPNPISWKRPAHWPKPTKLHCPNAPPVAPQFGSHSDRFWREGGTPPWQKALQAEVSTLLEPLKTKIPMGLEDNKGKRLAIIFNVVDKATAKPNDEQAFALIQEALVQVETVADQKIPIGFDRSKKSRLFILKGPQTASGNTAFPTVWIADTYVGHVGIIGSNGAIQIQNKLPLSDEATLPTDFLQRDPERQRRLHGQTFGYDKLFIRATEHPSEFVVFNKAGADGRDVFGNPLKPPGF